MIDNETSGKALGFLVWFRKFYSGTTGDTYMKIANNYKQCNYGTVRNYILELSERGYVTIKNRAKRSQRFIVNEEKFIKTVM
jgi:hypothetical protein